MLAAAAAQLREEPGVGWDEPHVRGDWFHDHRGDLRPELREDGVDRGGVVVGHDHRVGGGAFRDPRRPRDAERGDAAARRDEERIDVPVVAAGELHDLRAAGHAAGEAHGGHRRLRPRRDEAHLLDGRDGGRDRLRELELAGGRRAVRRAVGGGALHRLDDLGMRVPEDRRAPRLHVVEVLAPVGVDEVGAVRACDEERVAADGRERTNR